MWTKLGLGVLWVARAVAAAVLHGGSRRCAMFQGFQGLRPTRSSAKKTREVSRVLTEAWNGRGRDTDVPAARSSGGSRAALTEGVLQGFSDLWIP